MGGYFIAAANCRASATEFTIGTITARRPMGPRNARPADGLRDEAIQSRDLWRRGRARVSAPGAEMRGACQSHMGVTPQRTNLLTQKLHIWHFALRA